MNFAFNIGLILNLFFEGGGIQSPFLVYIIVDVDQIISFFHFFPEL